MTRQKIEISGGKTKRVALLSFLTLFAILVDTSMPNDVSAASKIAVLVNKVPITSNDISRRAAFFKLRRIKGNHRKLARAELIDEAMKMQEARRLRQIVSSKEVDAAYARFAKRNKMPLKVLTQIMNRSGVTVRGFKQYIRAQMSWQRAVALRAQSQGRSTRAKNPLDHLHGAKGKKTGNTTEYTIQQIVFVVPRDQLQTRSAARLAEANNFRSRFPGCQGSVGLASSLKNVSVLDKGRKQAHELPARWRKEIESTSPGKTTRPLKTEKGVELLAVCKKRSVISKLDAASEDDIFSKTVASDADLSALEKGYLEQLRKVAVIKNR